ncbi:MAG TPA: hypothetical protein VF552_06835 [Allosphingosinicella sp.]|jgi:hypothetical protein
MIAFVLASCGDGSEDQQNAAGTGADAPVREAPPASDAPDQVRDAEVATHEAEGPFTGIMIAEDGTPVKIRYRKVGVLAIAGGDMIVGTHAQLQQRLRLFQDLQDGTLDAGGVPRQQREALEQFAERRAMAGEDAAPARRSRSALRLWGWGTTGSI